MSGMQLDPGAESSKIFGKVLLPNVPHLVVSSGYFMLNSLVTIMVGASEYNSYAKQRKPLRVSSPRGAQRSTYYLSLPYKYSISMLVVSALLHWLVSQSFFFVQIVASDIDGVERKIITCGYSPIGITFTIVLGVLFLFAVLIIGLRRFKSPMPLAGQCSAVISAACHPSTSSVDDDANHALKPVQWGEIPASSWPSMESSIQSSRFENPFGSEETGVYHCSFTSEEVVDPQKRRNYI